MTRFYGDWTPANGEPLSSLSALSYSMHVIKRPNALSAPTIHVSLLDAALPDGKKGFTNLVFEPYQNGEFEINRRYTLDAFTGKWWSTRATQAHKAQELATLEQFKAANPDAKIVAISVDNGGSSMGTIPPGEFDAGADNVVIGMGTDFTRYDFGA